MNAASSPSHEPNNDTPYFVDVRGPQEEESEVVLASGATLSDSTSARKKRAAPRRMASKGKKGAAAHKEGVFSPVVVAAKFVLGDARLNKIRGNAIALHSDIIKGFVATSDSSLGQAVLVRLFSIADRNGDGKLDKEEVSDALQKLGFSWLQEKQIGGIVKRADLDENGVIEFDEFVREAPKTLKTNLVKLAKKNGGELGFLA